MKQKSIKNIRKDFKDKGIFYTPPEIAEKLKSYVNMKIQNVYDPTCGAGNLLKVFPDDVKKYGQEIDEEQLKLINMPNFIGYAGDTLKDDGFKNEQFDCIVANPPFSIKWEADLLKNDIRFKNCAALPPPSKADWAFMLHILHHLSDEGIAVVLEFPGILYRGQREGKVRRWFVEKNYIDRIVNVPKNTFEDTAIPTAIIVLRKNKKTTDIIFEDGERIEKINIEKIIENDFDLSINLYIQEEIIKEKIDPIAIENEARVTFLKRLRKELEFEKIVCNLEGISIRPFIESIKNVVSEYEKES